MPALPALVYKDEISLRGIIETIRLKRWLILSITLITTALAGTAALVVDKKYTASVVLTSATNTNGSGALGGMSSSSSAVGGLAALAGASILGDSKKSEAIATLQSESLTEGFIRDNNLLPILYSKEWNPATKQWKVTDPKDKPTVWKANLFFKTKVRSLVIDPKTGLVTLSIEWNDPQLAAKWANGLVNAANDYLRIQAINESQRTITYLTDQAAKIDAVSVRQSLYGLMQSEINKIALAKGNEEFSLKILDAAVAPDVPSYPKLPLWLLMGFISGFMIAVVVVFIQSSWNNK